MAQAEASRQNIPPRVREALDSALDTAQTSADTVGTTTISAAYDQTEVQALRDNTEAALDNLITAIRDAFGATES